MCDCDELRTRVADLEEEVRYLKRELGMSAEPDAVQTLTDAFREKMGLHGRGAAKIALLLYNAQGRSVTIGALLEGLPPIDRSRDPLDRGESLIRVLISRARSCLGREAIQTVWGRGYRMSPAGLEIIAAILNECGPQGAIPGGRLADAPEDGI